MRYSELFLSLTCSFLLVACSEDAPSQVSTALPLPPSDVSSNDLAPPADAMPAAGGTRPVQLMQVSNTTLTMSQAELDKLYLEARQHVREAVDSSTEERY